MTNIPVKFNVKDLVKMFSSEESITNVLSKSCNAVRNSFSCPNSRLCKDSFTENGHLIKREREKNCNIDYTVTSFLFFFHLTFNL